jgi:phage-related baseplate assembly protein
VRGQSRSRANPDDLTPPAPGTLTLKFRVQVHDDHRRALAARLELSRPASAGTCTAALEQVLEKYLADLRREGEEIFRRELRAALASTGDGVG